MATLNVTNKSSIHLPEPMKLRPGTEKAAAAAARADGADNVFIQTGRDTFVSSARSLDLRDLKVGDVVTLEGRPGRVILVDDEANRPREAARKAFDRFVDAARPIVAGSSLIGAGATGYIMANTAATVGYGSGLSVAGAGVVGLGAGALTAGAYALAGATVAGAAVISSAAVGTAFKKVDTEALKRFAD
ncbi:MAG: hypothetical protein VKP72_08090 [bacterium]|nr:hypothetical protein [bacterium]